MVKHFSLTMNNLRAPENVIVNNLLPDGSFPEHPAVVVRSDLFLAQVENWRLEVLYESQSSKRIVFVPLTLYRGSTKERYAMASVFSREA